MKVIVVGAGLSGLLSAKGLHDAGHEVVVLEARNRIGGRVLTVRDGLADGQYLNVGAMILYEGQPNILELCERYDIGLSGEVYDTPLHQQPVFAAYADRPLPGAELLCARHICLPLYPTLDENDADYVVESLISELS